MTAAGNCGSRRAAITLKLTGVQKIYLDNWWNIVNSEKLRFSDFQFILVTTPACFVFFFSGPGWNPQSEAQLASEERGRGMGVGGRRRGGAGGEVSAADLLWLLPGPARLNLRHTKHGALEVPLLVLSHIRFLATLNMALSEGCIPLDPTRDSSREVCPDPDCSRPASRRRHSHCRRRRSSSVSVVGL